jgi:hypothetical protein
MGLPLLPFGVDGATAPISAAGLGATPQSFQRRLLNSPNFSEATRIRIHFSEAPRTRDYFLGSTPNVIFAVIFGIAMEHH